MRPLLARLRQRTGLLILTSALLAGLVGSGIAAAAVTGHSGTTVTRVSVLTQDSATTYTSSAAWTTVGSTTVYGLTGQWVDSRFTAESACYGSLGSWCSVQILIDGFAGEPVVGTDFAFNSVTNSGGANGTSASGWASNSVERFRTFTTTTSHTIVVQARIIGTATLRLDDWTLVNTVVTP